MSQIFDSRQVRRRFSRAASQYQAAAQLQAQVRGWLLETLAFYDDPVAGRGAPQRVLDLGAGPALAAIDISQRWPKADVVALDFSHAMLAQARIPRSGLLRRSAPIARICADARALPFADGCFDVVFSNLCLQWVDDLPATLRGLRRVLKPGGMLLFSTFGPATLQQLRAAFAQVDNLPHVSPFADISAVGDALVQAGFRDPVLDRDILHSHCADFYALLRELQTIGATNALQQRRNTLTGRARFAAAAAAYPKTDPDAATVQADWEIISALAWAPALGQTLRMDDGAEVAHFAADAIRVRRR